MFFVSILSKFKSRKLSKALMAVAASGILFFNSADVQASPDAEAKFRQAYLSEVPADRAFNQHIDFFSPTFHADMDSHGQVVNSNALYLSGNLNWNYTNPSNNNTINMDIPFFLTQEGSSDMALYVQRSGKWTKFLLPGMPSGFVSAVKASDNASLINTMKVIRNVELFRDTNAQQIFLVTLDGNYLAQLMANYTSTRGEDAVATRENHEFFSRNLQAALRKNDIHCTWTYNKTDNHSVTLVVDFTELLRSYAVNVLNEVAAGVTVLNDEDIKLFETIGYYSECHYSVSYLTYDKNDTIAPTDAALKAPASRNIFDDLVREMVTTVRRK
jgi:hypothetical protein